MQLPCKHLISHKPPQIHLPKPPHKKPHKQKHKLTQPAHIPQKLQQTIRLPISNFHNIRAVNLLTDKLIVGRIMRPRRSLHVFADFGVVDGCVF